MFQAVLPLIIRSTKTVHTASGIVKPILLTAAIVDEMERSSISSTIAAAFDNCLPSAIKTDRGTMAGYGQMNTDKKSLQITLSVKVCAKSDYSENYSKRRCSLCAISSDSIYTLL